MHGDVLIFVLVVVFGCAAFGFGIVYLFCKFVGALFRGVKSLFGGAVRKENERQPYAPRPVGRVEVQGRGVMSRCPRCGQPESRPATYCGQCGTAMQAQRVTAGS